MAHTPSLAPLSTLFEPPYNRIVAYPSGNSVEVSSRLIQLGQLSVTALDFKGKLRIDRLSVLGKGVVGIVVIGIKDSRQIAVKIRRVDARRRSLIPEFEHLRIANSLGVGPVGLGCMPNVLAMEFIEGLSLPAWLETLKGRGRRARVRAVVRNLLEQCMKLDAYGLDHGELSRAHKNVIISSDDNPRILDFESASLMRRPRNFTSLTQYMFLGGSIAKKTTRILGPVDKEGLLGCLRDYKSGGWRDAFEAALEIVGF